MNVEGAHEQQAQPPSDRMEALVQQEQPLEVVAVESLLPKEAECTAGELSRAMEQQQRRRSKILLEQVEDLKETDEWEGNVKEDLIHDGTDEWKESVKENSIYDGTFASRIKELPDKGQELIQVASCLGSFDSILLRAATALSEKQVSKFLSVAAEKDIVKQDGETGEYLFCSDEAQKEAQSLIPSEKRSLFRAAIGRNLVRKLSQDDLKNHISILLLQFRRGLDAVTSQTERYAIAALCLRAVQWAVEASDFRTAACNYSEFGIVLLGDDCWKDDYDLSLALYNASAELYQCIGDFKRVDKVVAAVLENARCYRDTLQVRATHVHSLSSQYRNNEALKEALDVLAHVGEHFPPRPRKYHVAIDLMRTKRLIAGKTNEMIMRIPMMENTDKMIALQILNLAFPIAYRTNPMLNGLFASRMVRLTLQYGFSKISAVGFASFSSMLTTFYRNKQDGFRCTQLALDLLDRFDAKEYVARVYVFVYAEVFVYKKQLREVCPFLLNGYHKGLETGDIQFAMVSAIMFEGYAFFSGQAMSPIEEETTGFCQTAEAFKHETALSMLRPDLKFLRILMGKFDKPTCREMLKPELAVTMEANDKATSCILHFLQSVLAYIFNDFETAASEAIQSGGVLIQPYIHPGFSCLLTFFGLSLLAVVPYRHGLARRKLLTSVKRSIKLLELFAASVPGNCLHSLNLVQAELALVNRQFDRARSKYLIAIAVALKSNDMMMHAVACERFALFLRDRGDESGATANFREAHSTYAAWGAMAKVHEMEKVMPELIASQ